MVLDFSGMRANVRLSSTARGLIKSKGEKTCRYATILSPLFRPRRDNFVSGIRFLSSWRWGDTLMAVGFRRRETAAEFLRPDTMLAGAKIARHFAGSSLHSTRIESSFKAINEIKRVSGDILILRFASSKLRTNERFSLIGNITFESLFCCGCGGDGQTAQTRRCVYV